MPHQRAAIDAVLGVVRRQPFVPLTEALAAGREHGVVANRLTVPASRLLADLHAVQAGAGLPRAELAECPQLSVEMETGTGKTYVYLRTLLELSRRHGLRKLVIVVPSVAIREGVLETLRITREHFSAVLPGLDYHFFAYDGGRLHRLRAFVRSARVELMVLTLDAFNKASNRLRQPHDGFGGHPPLALLQAVRPVLVLDEPQRMESPRSRAALADLMPLLVLRYSATHRHHHALVHRLTPRQAYEQGLVKRIEVAAPAAGVQDRATRIAAQVRTTVELHLRRQAHLRPRGIKVLSLLFVERVDDWVAEDGVVAQCLRQALEQAGPEHAPRAGWRFEEVCAAYFAERRRGGHRRPIDSKTGRSEADERAYALIMRDKQRLLSLDEPVSFIVSHSALREGWDNPNVFQICTLASSHSAVKKRQEIGRGVRLAVDQTGRRVADPEVDVLTVITNDSYEAYVAGLQAEDAERVDACDVAPAPSLAGEPGTITVAAVVDPGPPAWVRIDSEALRTVAVARARNRSELVAGASPVDAPARAVREGLLRCRPRCLVSAATIAAVLDAMTQGHGATWPHVERAVEAIEHALRQQAGSGRPSA
ncbi:MAG: DEAD/DEAH box helicase family protein [Nannocystaceae bacterium]